MINHSTSLNEMARNILNILRGGRSSQTELYSLDQIKKQIKYYRALLIRRDQEANNNQYRMFEQDLGHVPVSIVDTAEDASVTSGNQVLRTDEQIPTPIRLKNTEAVTFIGNKDKIGEPVPLLSDDRAYWQSYNKYTADECFATYRDGYIYVHNTIALQNINIRGIFEDPEEVHNFTRANGLDLYDEDSPFPIPQDMVQRITQAIINTEGQTTIQTPNDTELDANQGN